MGLVDPHLLLRAVGDRGSDAAGDADPEATGRDAVVVQPPEEGHAGAVTGRGSPPAAGVEHDGLRPVTALGLHHADGMGGAEAQPVNLGHDGRDRPAR